MGFLPESAWALDSLPSKAMDLNRQQRSQRLRTPHTWQSSVQCSLSKILSAFHQVALFFSPFSLNLWGAKQFFFTVGGNKSQTVSNYLKNKTTHTKQNKTLCCQLLRDSEQLPARRLFSQPPVPTILSQRVWRACAAQLIASMSQGRGS